jgi:predicted dienelactone hydrolase
MKWLARILAVLVLLGAGVVALAFATALRASRPVGFQVVRVDDPGNAPLAVALWYPTESRSWPTTLLGLVLMDVAPNSPVSGQALPLVVISHGNGGGPGSHADTAMSLAGAGFVVAAPLHPGDNYLDQSAVGSSRWLPDRSRDIRSTVDYILTGWSGRDHVAAQRIGVFGFSAGALTALTAIGAEPDLSLVASHCATTQEFACTLLREANSGMLAGGDAPAPTAFVHDERIRAAVVAAPGLGFTLSPTALSHIAVPVQLWSGDADTNVPYATNTGPVREALGALVEFHAVPGARHFSFLAPCGVLGPPLLCRDGQGFDRAAFHRSFNAQVTDFFRAKLPAAAADSQPNSRDRAAGE